ncbi:MAG: hypothetical protein HYZ94_02600 [Candidatus Omnitrophica bacterium]|nr:hypothetical protein [Candidatus Omnitrophota bacterium]
MSAPSREPRFPLGLFAAFLAVTAGILLALGGSVLDSHRAFQRTIPRETRIKELVGIITHLDEVLTMSARMAAATGDLSWEERYLRYEPHLDSAIKEAIRITPRAYAGKTAEQTDAANLALVEMEKRSFDAVRRGSPEEAREILFSPAYERQKRTYAEGMRGFVQALEREEETALQRMRRRALYSTGLAAAGLPLLLLAWGLFLRTLRVWKKALEELNRTLDEKVAERTAQLEKEIQQRSKTEAVLEAKLRELESINKIMMDREGRILELKDEVRTLRTGRGGVA